MTTRMLIDARHPEETRVAVLKGNRIEEFDFESADKKQIKGNIYLAKVTRVEPSLQAAFVDFGGNRHGFLAFSEIHPDYYQIPREDREALLAEEAAAAEEEERLRAAEEENDGFDDNGGLMDEFAGDDGIEEIDTSEKDDVATIEGGLVDGDLGDESSVDDEDGAADEAQADDGRDERSRGRGRGRRQGRARSKEAEELRARRMALRRRYKIQDVIQRRQVLLVQVVKEERGNKGAALTSYLSLAGRYTVLMPNSSHGGGISRKISSSADRKRLKQIVAELKLPKSMGCIIRTAGLQRTKTEIKRDFDYLARLWDEIRDNTLSSTAPAMIHSDSDLIKRAIRDIYNRDIEEVVVEGEEGYKAARQFMKLLMPSHARRVKQYADPVPLFQRFGAEDQLTAMYDPVVQLKSGGYLVINPTEALVSIDINSGRSTKEHGIEATALSTNLEAAREIARQLRLRDMAGLVVIDFIDMEYSSNIRKVERAMKDALKHDRARIQVGRISSFGLMEMSRQRLRTGVLEATTRACPHCDGTGLVRTASSAGLSALRLIEDEAAKGKGTLISLYASTEAAIYLLNQKRADLAEIEDRYGVTVEVLPEGENEGAKMRAVSAGPRPANTPRFEPLVLEDDFDDVVEEEDEEFEAQGGEDDRDETRRKRRRRRGGRNRKRRDQDGEYTDAQDGDELSDDDGDDTRNDAEEHVAGESDEAEDTLEGEDRPKKRRRRGGRRRKKRMEGDEALTEADSEADEGLAEHDADASTESEPADILAPAPEAAEAVATETVDVAVAEVAEAAEVTPAKPRRSRRKKAEPAAEETAVATDEEAAAAAPAEAAAEETPVEEVKPKRRTTRRKKADTETPAEAAAPEADATPAAEDTPPAKPKRTRRKKVVPAEEATATENTVTAPAQAEEAAPAPQVEAVAEPAAEAADTPADETEASPPRRGWWQRTFGE